MKKHCRSYRLWSIHQSFIEDESSAAYSPDILSSMTLWNSEALKRSVALWLRQGVSPGRLALTLSLGFAIGCIPVVGVPTVVCAALALMLRLNQPAIQAANYAAMPLQVALIVPFVRLGERLFPFTPHRAIATEMLLRSPFGLLVQMGSFAGQAMLAWLLIAGPAIAVMTLALTVIFRSISVVAAARTSAETGH